MVGLRTIEMFCTDILFSFSYRRILLREIIQTIDVHGYM